MGMKSSSGYNDSSWDSNKKDDRNWCKYKTFLISCLILSYHSQNQCIKLRIPLKYIFINFNTFSYHFQMKTKEINKII